MAHSKSKQKFVGRHTIWAAITDVTSHLLAIIGQAIQM